MIIYEISRALNDLRAKDAAAKEFASKVFMDEELEGRKGMKPAWRFERLKNTSPARTEQD